MSRIAAKITDASREEIVEYELERERTKIEEWLDEVEDPDNEYRPSRSYEELLELKDNLEETGDG